MLVYAQIQACCPRKTTRIFTSENKSLLKNIHPCTPAVMKFVNQHNT